MLIPEDGTGLPNSDSLASVEFADNYHFNRGNDIWETFSLSRKEQLLRQATDYIKYIFGPSFAGVQVYPGVQALPFPRIILGINVGNPVEIQEATSEFALFANSSPLMPNQTTSRKKRVKVGPIEVEYDVGGFNGPRFISASSRLIPYLTGGANVAIATARLIRT
jgi:hypothetical protein